MSMFNECHIHLCDCNCLNVFSYAQSLLINHKKDFKCLVVFGKYFVLAKIVKIFKNSVALFWWLSPRLVQSHALVASSHWDFSRLTASQCPSREKCLEYFSNFGFLMFLVAQSSDLFVGGRSSHEGYTKIFAAYLTTSSWMELPVAKNT